MGLVSKQNEFLTHVALLILQAQDMGFEVTGGDLYRANELQLVYFHGKQVIEQDNSIVLKDRSRRSKTMNSKHLKRLAIDLNFFKNGVYINGLDKIIVKKHLQPIGDYWKSLHPDNEWGGNWKSFFDSPHFERK